MVRTICSTILLFTLIVQMLSAQPFEHYRDYADEEFPVSFFLNNFYNNLFFFLYFFNM